MRALSCAPREESVRTSGSAGRGRLAGVTGLLTLLIVSAFPMPAAGAEEAWISERAASLRARAIRIRTVNPPGDEGPLADLLVAELAREGIEARAIELAGHGERGVRRAAVFARLPGSAGGSKPLILLSHLDVVPARESEWQRDPFGGQIEDGHVYGRGALDAKGVTVIQALTLVLLSRRADPLDRAIISVATPDEEARGQAGPAAIVRAHPALLAASE